MEVLPNDSQYSASMVSKSGPSEAWLLFAGAEERWEGEDHWADAGSQVSFPSSRPAETTASGILEDMSFDSGLQVGTFASY